MAIEIKVPIFPESITEGSIATWYKKPGEAVKRDEQLVDIETDKVVLEVSAPADGTLEKILKEKGETVKTQEVIGLFKEGASSGAEAKAEAKKEETPSSKTEEKASALSPALRRLLSENGLEESQVKGTGENGQITREDILKKAQELKKTKEQKSEEKPKEKQEEKPKEKQEGSREPSKEGISLQEGRPEKRVPMTRLRARIAERLLASQHNAALLTTFNEINMQHVIELRQKFKEAFEKTYGIRLGFMSFFTLAVIEALKQFPMVNASVDGNDIVYHGFYDIGIAVSSERGLVVPVIRNADTSTLR